MKKTFSLNQYKDLYNHVSEINNKLGYYDNFFNWYKDAKPYRGNTAFRLFYFIKFNRLSQKLIEIYQRILRNS